MTKEFVPYEQALALKELGFDEDCFGLYNPIFYLDHNSKNSIIDALTDNKEAVCSAPLYQQAFRWFREKYQLHSTITSISQESWQWHITKPGESLGKLYDEDFYTYEEAELACLTKLIEITFNSPKL